jgi:3-oxoacyl-[acyl-carrier-protein] synthase-1/3-oxoacyl-[acyl-carrier-protein] synthase II
MDRIRSSNPAAVLARAFGLTGPCQTIVNACSSGTDAVGLGASWIEAGLCDLVLAGGADELGRITCNGFISMRISAPGPCRPFDRDREGLNLGEGAAVLVLEAPELLRRRRARARSFVLGYGSSCDAYHPTAPSPDGAGLDRAIQEAMAAAGIQASQVAFVNAHGTATPDNDRVEGRVLAATLPGVPFLSTKGFTGHTLGAAGAIEAAFTVACLEQGRIPACAGFKTPDPDLGAVPVTENTIIRGTVALSQSLAFGGNNAVLALGLDSPSGPRPDREWGSLRGSHACVRSERSTEQGGPPSVISGGRP